jgi:hypothetical protein
MRAISVAVVSGILLLASWENVASARVSGVASRPVAPGHVGPRYNRTFRGWPLYGGFIGAPAFAPDGFFDYPSYPPFAPDGSAAATGYSGEVAAPVQQCQNPTHRTVTVRSEAGGTKDVTITYCHP